MKKFSRKPRMYYKYQISLGSIITRIDSMVKRDAVLDRIGM